MKKALRVLDENRNIVAVAVVAVVLIAGAIFLKARAQKKLNEDAWADLARMGGHLETSAKVKELLKRYEGTSAEMYFRMSLARKLYDDSRKVEASSRKEDIDLRLKALSDAVEELAICVKEFPDHPAAADARLMYDRLSADLEWARKYPGKFDPKAPDRVWQKKIWNTAEGKKDRHLDHLDDKVGQRSQVTLETAGGSIVIELFEDDAPNHAANFISLVQEGYLDGKEALETWETHVKFGSPSDQKSVYAIAPEVTVHKHGPGMLAMAIESGFESSGQKFYIARTAMPDNDGKVTIFGKVVLGLDVLASLKPGDKIIAAWLDKKRMKDYYPMVRFLPEEPKDGGKGAGGSAGSGK